MIGATINVHLQPETVVRPLSSGSIHWVDLVVVEGAELAFFVEDAGAAQTLADAFRAVIPKPPPPPPIPSEPPASDDVMPF
jgi:hypothetical protein